MNFCGIRRYNVQTNRVNQILISGKEVDLFISSDKFQFHRKKKTPPRRISKTKIHIYIHEARHVLL